MNGKKVFALIPLLIIAFAIGFFGCPNGDDPNVIDPNGPDIPKENGDHPVRPNPSTFSLPRQVGDYLRLTPMVDNHAVISNNTGMSGSEGRNHWHNNTATDMYAGSKTDLVYDIGRIEQLGELHIWNYNAVGNTNYGIRNVIVSYSEDNVSYVQLGSFTLKQADGSARLAATNLTDGSYIDFYGRSARYIKFSPVDNYGGGQYGLSQIRLFRFKQDVYKGAYISASPIERYGSMPPRDAYNITNGAGLSHPFDADATHSNNPAHMYHAAPGAGFAIDLKGKYPVSKIVIWNYNDPANLDYGLQTIRISTSITGTSWTTVPGIGNLSLPPGTGQDDLEPSLTIDVDLHTRYIRIDRVQHLGGTRMGLSAVRVYTGEGWFTDNAPDWTAMFSNYNSWTGADGIYMVNLDGKDYDTTRNPDNLTTFIIFSDTMTGTVNPVTGSRSGSIMRNNTYALLQGWKPDATKINFHVAQSGAMFVPDPPQPRSYGSGNKYYWMGDTFVIGDKLYMFGLRIDHISGGSWGFMQDGVDLLVMDIVEGGVDRSTLRHINDTERRLCNPDVPWYLGGSVVVNTTAAGAVNPDGYVYVYGYHDESSRRCFVARVLAEHVEDLSQYRYLSANNEWVDNMNNPKFLADRIAPEYSVHEVKAGPDRGKLYLVNTLNTIGNDIRLWSASSFTDAFSNETSIFYHDTDTAIAGTENSSYNAKANPAISTDKELFISYNMNGGMPAFGIADIYRPRFVRYAQVPVVF